MDFTTIIDTIRTNWIFGILSIAIIAYSVYRFIKDYRTLAALKAKKAALEEEGKRLDKEYAENAKALLATLNRKEEIKKKSEIKKWQ